MKKTISFIMAMFLVFPILASCNGQSAKSENVKVYTLLASEKYMQDEEITFDESNELSFIGMKNEIQSAQVMFNSNKQVNEFDLITADLLHSDGSSKIEKANVSVYAEGYVNAYSPFFQSEEYVSLAGWYPDSIIPLDRYKTRKEDRVAAGNNQALWIDISIPADATPGDYTATFKLEVNDTVKELDVSLKVYDLTMPDAVHNPSAFDIWYEYIANGEGSNMDADTYDRYYEYLWTKRLNCEYLPTKYNSDFNVWLDKIEELAVNEKCTVYCFKLGDLYIEQDKICPKITGTYTDAQIAAEKIRIKDGFKQKFQAILDRNLSLRKKEATAQIDLFDKLGIYYEDEPPAGSTRMKSVRIICELINTAKKEIIAENAAAFAEHPDLLVSFEDVDEFCPSNYMNDGLFVSEYPEGHEKAGQPNYELSDGLTHWCPEMYKYNEEAFRKTSDERLALGEKVWWYLCVSNTPKPSYYVESQPLNIRMQQWMQYDYGIQGVLYWETVHWSLDRDNYTDLTYYNYGCGEGILLYPGVRYGMKEPISSWRLENIRLGQQDYELFYMLNEYLTANKADVTARQVITKIGKGLYTGTVINSGVSSADLEAQRVKLLEILELFAAGNNQAAMAMVNQIA